MIAIVLLSFLALGSAAPHYRDSPFDDIDFGHYLEDEIFDTRRFWQEMRREMMNLDAMLADLGKHFPSTVSSEGIEGNTYKITIPLSGYAETEIVVKAKKGLLVVQAVHEAEGQPQRSYVAMRTLPDFVDGGGNWTFEDGMLKIVFPINNNTDVVKTDVTEAPHSREEMEPQTDRVNIDADVGAGRGDLDKGLSDNEIPQNEVRNAVEATTYAVDLKDEIELVPVHYR